MGAGNVKGGGGGVTPEYEKSVVIGLSGGQKEVEYVDGETIESITQDTCVKLSIRQAKLVPDLQQNVMKKVTVYTDPGFSATAKIDDAGNAVITYSGG